MAELAASLPTVQSLHYVDRTVIPWQAKDIGRDTLVGYHNGKTLSDLPFAGERRNALYRKLEDNAADMARMMKTHPSLKGAVPGARQRPPKPWCLPTHPYPVSLAPRRFQVFEQRGAAVNGPGKTALASRKRPARSRWLSL